MPGLEFSSVAVGYILTLGLTAACIIYGILKWNSDSDEESAEGKYGNQ